MKKKLLYISNEFFETKDGIAGKKISQVKCFSKSFDVYLTGYIKSKACMAYLHDGMYVDRREEKIWRRFLYRYWFQRDVMDLFLEERPINIYIRYYRSDHFFVSFLAKVKSIDKDTKIVIEFPTYPYDGELQHNYFDRLKLCVDRFYRRKLRRYVDYAVTYSNDDYIFGIPCIKTCNGIDSESICICNNYQKNDGIINILAVSSMSIWHGYDRMIQGMAEYYRKHDKQDVILHLVGDGKEIENYKNLVKDNKLDEVVMFYGFKKGVELEKISKKCNIALSSLGLHRIGLDFASTLKSREYCAQGFPIISSVKLDFIDDDKWVCYVPPDESPVDVLKIRSFFDSIYPNAGYEINKLTKKYRDKVVEKCDMNVTLREVLDFYNED